MISAWVAFSIAVFGYTSANSLNIILFFIFWGSICFGIARLFQWGVDQTYNKHGFIQFLFIVAEILVVFSMILFAMTPLIHAEQLHTCEYRDAKVQYQGTEWPVSVQYCTERTDVRGKWGPWVMVKIAEFHNYR